MNKPIRILAVMSMLFVASCASGGTELNETEAKAQVAAMKKEVEKEDFALPTLGMEISSMSMTSGGNTLSFASDVRFNVNKGSRYLYCKTDSLLFASSTTCYYEKNGKYYYYTSSYASSESGEFSSEAEFEEAFNATTQNQSVNDSSLREATVNFLSSVSSYYDSTTMSSSGLEGSYDVKFVKTSDSSFTCTVKGKMTRSEADEDMDVSIEIEVENYLPKKRVITADGTSSGEAVGLTTSETYTWGSVDYIYPTAE